LCGLTRPDHGEIDWDGRSIASVRDEFNAALTYIGHTNALKDDLDPVENLEAALDIAGRARPAGAAREALVRLGLEACLGLPAKLLSQGQKRRVTLARLWLSAASPLWVLDEPFVALDSESTEHLRLLLAAHLERDGILVLTTHQEIDVAPQRMERLRLDA
jgi:heme exporter protein A